MTALVAAFHDGPLLQTFGAIALASVAVVRVLRLDRAWKVLYSTATDDNERLRAENARLSAELERTRLDLARCLQRRWNGEED